MQVTLLNPFSVNLDKYPFMQVNKEPMYIKGDYKIYKLYDKYFVHTFKNIVIAERCGANKNLIENLINGTEPTNESDKYFEYERLKWAISKGIESANKLNFKIN